MSTIAEASHPLQMTAGATEGLTEYYLKDLNAIPESAFDLSPMGCARSPRSITVEVIGVNYAVAAILAGEKTLSEEEAMARYSHIATKAEAAAELKASVEVLNRAALALSPEDLGTNVTAPWGAEMTKARLYTTMSYHIMYHDGQLNYFQCLQGDEGYHWHD